MPPVFHKPLTLQALAAGKHVLVEQPAFPALADFGEAIAAAYWLACVVLLGQQRRLQAAGGGASAAGR